MAKGDAVNGISADNTVLDYQPASGVESVITWSNGSNIGPILYNGTTTNTSTVAFGSAGSNLQNSKMFINNTRYLRLLAQGAGNQAAYTGVQTK